MDDYLTQNDKDQLGYLADNKLMREAVKKVFLRGLYYDGTLQADPMKNFILATTSDTITNENLGALVRARTEAIRILDHAFKVIDSFKKVEKTTLKEAIHV